MVKTDIWISQRTNTGTSSTKFVWFDEILKAKVLEVKVSFLLRLIFWSFKKPIFGRVYILKVSAG